MPIKIFIFLFLINLNLFSQMEILKKIDFDDEIYDVSISGGYAFIYGIKKIYLLDLIKEDSNPEEIISFKTNDLGGRILLSKNYFALNYRYYGFDFVSVYDITDAKKPKEIFKSMLPYSNFRKEREFEWFKNKSFFLDGYFLHYRGLDSCQIYDLQKKDICIEDCCAASGYIEIKENKLMIRRISDIFKISYCKNCDYEVLYYLVDGFILDIIDNLNGLMAKYKDKAIGGMVGFWADPPGVASQQIGFRMFDTSRVSEGYLISDNYFDYNWAFLGKYGWCVDGEKQLYDLQDLLVKNGYIYISSYSLCSVVSADISKPWDIPGYIPGTEFTILENEENCYCFKPEECYIFNHPFGMDASNNKLYVANKRNLYILKLKRDDEEYPIGGIYYIKKKQNGKLIINGWAQDSEGIRNILARIGNYQFFHTPQEKVHKRPFYPKEYVWNIEIDLTTIENGEYDFIVLVEDMDGDFSILLNDKLKIEE
jgi:hypothetical protein